MSNLKLTREFTRTKIKIQRINLAARKKIKMPKKVTNEALARMMAKGFEDMAAKGDLEREVASIRHHLDEIKLKFDHGTQI